MPRKRPPGVQIHANQIEMVPLADLKPYERNARTHDEAQIEALAKVIKDSGFTAPLVLEPDGTIIAGHGRLEAARLAGHGRLEAARLAGMAAVPCVRVANLSAAQIKALRLSDNQLGSGSGTSIIAAEMTGRRCLALELSPIYVDVGVRRWQAFTGREATLEATGQTFAEVERERLGEFVEEAVA